MSLVYRDLHSKGKKAAVLIGINYTGSDAALQGCENDILEMKAVLTSKGFQGADIVCMTEDAGSTLTPTRKNILRVLRDLQKKTLAGYDHIVIHYSGHGTQEKEVRPSTAASAAGAAASDEFDGQDEAWYTLDDELIKDDELRAVLNGFSPFCRVFVLVDACHSGSSLDLPLRYVGNADTASWENTTAPLCDVLMISGCKDAQTSEDAFFEKSNSFNGAMTRAFLAHYASSNTVFDLIRNMNEYMRTNGHNQEPQMSASRVLKGDEHLTEWLR